MRGTPSTVPTTIPLLMLLAAQAPIGTPYATTAPLSIGEIKATGDIVCGAVVDLAVDATATFDNPFDPGDVSLDAHIIAPGNKTYDVPGFYAREFTRTGNDAKPGTAGWHLRFCPQSPGEYRLTLTLRDRSGSKQSAETVLIAKGEPTRGFVAVSPRDRRYFETSDGTAFYPIGANVCWANAGIADYDRWFPKLGEQKANWARLWLGPSWTTFATEVAGKPEDGKGLGVFDQANCYHLDEALRIARSNGLYLQLCLDSYNELRDRDAYPAWDTTPHNRENGGPLRIWTDFWTSPQMDRLYRARLRYLVARYSAYPNLFAWELWNEVDLTRGFDSEVVRQWHDRMSKELKASDPYHHLVTTSFSGSQGVKSIDLVPGLDFVQTHTYNTDPVGTVAEQQTRKTAWGKPHFAGEVGADAGGPQASEDPLGVQIHDPQWASAAMGASGTAMPWWWDSYIESKSLYPLFGSIAKFVDGIDWPGESFRQAWPQMSFVSQPSPALGKDLVLRGPVSWDQGGANVPKTIRITDSGETGPLPVAGIQHGTTNHPDLHNPVRFAVSLAKATPFEVIVGDVSGYGGANLRIFLDGQRVLSRDFADPDGNTKTGNLTQYRGVYRVTIPKGKHAIIVENDGPDWFYVEYRFVGARKLSRPPLAAFAVIGDRTALAWLRLEDRTWQNVCQLKRNVAPCPPTVLKLSGMSAGQWLVEYWDTWNGRITGTTTVKVGNNGELRAAVPTITRDIALKLKLK